MIEKTRDHVHKESFESKLRLTQKVAAEKTRKHRDLHYKQ